MSEEKEEEGMKIPSVYHFWWAMGRGYMEWGKTDEEEKRRYKRKPKEPPKDYA